MKDTEKQHDVRLSDKLGLTAAVDVALKQTFLQCLATDTIYYTTEQIQLSIIYLTIWPVLGFLCA